MEKDAFYDRKIELELLQKKYHSLNSGEMLLIYGRRRVGKTELIRQFLKNISKNKLYVYVDLIEKQGLLDSLSRTVQEQLGETQTFTDMNDFLQFIESKTEKSFVLVIDEFQRFLEVAPEYITQLQNYWDTSLKKRKIMILLVGSSIGMIQRITNSKAGALYGRVTRIKISPFRYGDFRLMFKELSEEEKIVTYAVFGGTPYYLEKVKKEEGDIHKKIFELLLKKGAELYEEPKNLLEYEQIRIHAKYNSILQGISAGKKNLKELQDFTGIPGTTLSPYLQRLDTLLELVERKDPLLGKERQGKYNIKDPFFRFWYAYIFPNQTALHIGNTKLISDHIKENLNRYVGRVFEDICKELLILHINKTWEGYTLDFEDIGNWWNRSGEEIDILAYNKRSKKILVGEVKWTNQETDSDTIDKLLRKAKQIPLTGEYKFLFISKKGFTEKAKRRMKEIHAISLDLKDIQKMFENV